MANIVLNKLTGSGNDTVQVLSGIYFNRQDYVKNYSVKTGEISRNLQVKLKGTPVICDFDHLYQNVPSDFDAVPSLFADKSGLFNIGADYCKKNGNPPYMIEIGPGGFIEPFAQLNFASELDSKVEPNFGIRLTLGWADVYGEDVDIYVTFGGFNLVIGKSSTDTSHACEIMNRDMGLIKSLTFSLSQIKIVMNVSVPQDNVEIQYVFGNNEITYTTNASIYYTFMCEPNQLSYAYLQALTLLTANMTPEYFKLMEFKLENL